MSFPPAENDAPPFGRHSSFQPQHPSPSLQPQQPITQAPQPLGRAASRLQLTGGSSTQQQQQQQEPPYNAQHQQPQYGNAPHFQAQIDQQTQQMQQLQLQQNSQQYGAAPVYGAPPAASFGTSQVPLQAPSLGADPEGLDQSADPNAPRAHGAAGAAGAGGAVDDPNAWRSHPSLQQNLPEVVFYSKDPPSNLQICVRLRRQPDDAGLIGRPQTEKQLAWARKQEQLRKEAAERAAATAGNTTAGGAAAAANSAMLADTSLYSAEDDNDVSPGQRRNLSPDPSASYAPSVVTTQLFSWQQKTWSPAELLLAAEGHKSAASYADGALALLRASYPGEDPKIAAARLIASAPEGMMLSSMRDHDRYVDPDEMHKQVLTSSVREKKRAANGTMGIDEELNPLAKAMVLAPLAPHASASHLTREARSTPFHILATVNLPLNAPEQVKLTHKDASDLQSAGDESRAPRVVRSFQKQLLRLRIRDSSASQIRLEMRPGFSPRMKDPSRFDNAEWYSFTTPQGEVYRYRIENYSDPENHGMGGAAGAGTSSTSGDVSKRGSTSSGSFLAIEQARLDSELARLSAHEMHVQVSRSGRDFESAPTPGFERWHVLGEIVQLSGFGEEDLSVAYELDLRTPNPVDLSAADALNGIRGGMMQQQQGKDGGDASAAVLSSPWTASSDSVLEAISRDSSAVWTAPLLAGQERVRSCYVSMPFEWKLRTKTGPFLQPILYMQVWSVNRWGMRSVVGYAFLHLPREAGSHEFTLQTWSPVGTIREQMDRFFLGAAHPLDDVRRVGVPSPERLALQGRVLNRLGGPVLQPSGQIHIRMDIVQNPGRISRRI